MNKRFLSLVGVAAVLSVGTYVGLNILKPHTIEEVKVADTVPAEQVFGASVNNPEPETPAGTAPAAAPAAAPADQAAAPAAVATPAAPEATVDSASTAVAPPAPAAETAAAAPAPAETQPAAPAPAAAPSEPAQTAAAEPATAPVAAEPAPAATAPAEKPAKAKKSVPSKQHAALQNASSGKAVSNKAWWPDENPNKLSLVYAGQASFKQAIVLMFNGAFFNTDSITANLKVTDHSGKAVNGTWELGENNRRMLVFAVPAKGSYKVSVGSGLTDNKGRKLGARLSGPVQVR